MDLIQYCVILGEGPDKGLKHYVWATKQEVRKAIGEIQNRSPFFDNEELCCKGEDYEIRFTPEKVGSLVIKTKDMESARNVFLDFSEGPYNRA